MLTDSDRRILEFILVRGDIAGQPDPFLRQLQNLIDRGLVELVPKLTEEGRDALYPEGKILGPFCYSARNET